MQFAKASSRFFRVFIPSVQAILNNGQAGWQRSKQRVDIGQFPQNDHMLLHLSGHYYQALIL